VLGFAGSDGFAPPFRQLYVYRLPGPPRADHDDEVKGQLPAAVLNSGEADDKGMPMGNMRRLTS
jgi:hypothetical protein